MEVQVRDAAVVAAHSGAPAGFLGRVCRRHRLVIFHLCGQGKRGYRWRCKRCAGEAVTKRLQKVKRILVKLAGAVGHRRATLLLDQRVGGSRRYTNTCLYSHQTVGPP